MYYICAKRKAKTTACFVTDIYRLKQLQGVVTSKYSFLVLNQGIRKRCQKEERYLLPKGKVPMYLHMIHHTETTSQHGMIQASLY